MKTVPGVGIDVDLAIAAAFLLDRLDVAHRDRGVLLAEMQLCRHLRLLVGILGDLAAVIADGSRETVELDGGQERDGPAHAEADDADRAVLLGRLDRGLRVAHHRAPVRIGDEFARAGDLVRRIAALEIRLLTIEQGRRHRGVTLAGEPVAHRADVMIDAENLLDDDNAAPGRTARVGAIGAELEAVRRRQCELLTQDDPPSIERYPPRAGARYTLADRR